MKIIEIKKGKIKFNKKFLSLLLAGTTALTISGCSPQKQKKEIDVIQTAISKEELNTLSDEERKEIELKSGNDKAVIAVTSYFGPHNISDINLEIKDSTGKIIDNFITSNKEYIIDGLKIGEKYTIEELSSSKEIFRDYDIGEYVYNFKIEEDSNLDTNDYLITNYIDIKKQYKDKILSQEEMDNQNGWIIVSVRDHETKKHVPGGLYQITNNNGDGVEQWFYTGYSHRILNLSDGVYTIQEIKPSDGYISNNEIKTITIKEGKIYSDDNENKSREVTFYVEKELKLENTINQPKILSRTKYAE